MEAKPNIGVTIIYSDAYRHLILITLSPPVDNLVRSAKSLRFFEPVSKLSITVKMEINLRVIPIKHETVSRPYPHRLYPHWFFKSFDHASTSFIASLRILIVVFQVSSLSSQPGRACSLSIQDWCGAPSGMSSNGR